MWYLVFTKTRKEELAQENLDRQGFHTYLPKLQTHKRLRGVYQIVEVPLFPRYLFVKLNSEVGGWYKIRSTKGCISLVYFGTTPAKVPPALIEQLKLDEPNRIIQNKKSTPLFNPGEKVAIVDGLLAGYEGIIQAKNSQQRVSLLLTLAEDHTRHVELSVHQIKKIEA